MVKIIVGKQYKGIVNGAIITVTAKKTIINKGKSDVWFFVEFEDGTTRQVSEKLLSHLLIEEL